MITNCVLMIQRGNYLIAFNQRLRTLDERSQRIEMPGADESSRLSSEMAHRDISDEEKQLYAERSFTLEGYSNSQFLLVGASALCLSAVGLTLGVTWRGRSPAAG